MDFAPVWTPDPEQVATSTLARFSDWLAEHRNVDLADYRNLHTWSITEIDGFWSAVAEFFGLFWHERPTAVLGRREMPGAEWFPGGTLNYAEHALAPTAGRSDENVALICLREDGAEQQLTYGELRAQVARARAGLLAAGIAPGDRVVALAPNCVQTLVAFLAAASLGAVWSCCSPDFGARAAHDRFAQIEPTVLFAVDGYRFNGKSYDIRPTIDQLREQLPALRRTVLVPYLDANATLEGTTGWHEFIANTSELAFHPVPFDHPLWVLYSSGTTGLPKGIVHGHGGIVIEHLKNLALNLNLQAGDRFFWYTTTGWMMWNLLIGGLLIGSTVILYDGHPGYPDLDALWAIADKHRINLFGASAGYIQACARAGQRPRDHHDLSSLRMLGSTGSPLSVEGFRWIADAVGNTIQINSASGGTDICSAFLGGAPNVPVWLGELSCPSLGAAVQSYDEHGNPLTEEVGELVVTQPMPSMPVYFWNDPDGQRLRESYFDTYPGVWRHGDWVMITSRGTAIIYGRSDSTLNRGGVRMGTADFYAVVEAFEEVTDSLVVDTTTLSDGAAGKLGELLCFLVLAPDIELNGLEPKLREALRAQLSPRHVPNRFVVVNNIPRTLTGKKCEVPVRKILTGFDVDKSISRAALANPDALEPFIALAKTK